LFAQLPFAKQKKYTSSALRKLNFIELMAGEIIDRQISFILDRSHERAIKPQTRAEMLGKHV